MNTWWESLSSRERLILSMGMGVLLVAMVYLILWEPFQNQLRTLRQNVAEERIQVAWMEQAAIEAGTLRGVTTTEKPTAESLLALVDRSARASGMGPGLNRVEPEGKGKVRVWLNDIAFNTLIPWLAGLSKAHGVTPENLVIERQIAAGQVNVRLVLVGGGG